VTVARALPADVNFGSARGASLVNLRVPTGDRYEETLYVEAAAMLSRFPLAIVTLVALGTSSGLAGPVNTHGEDSKGLYQINLPPSASPKGPTLRPWTTTHGMSARGAVRPMMTIRPSSGFRLR
jgi:hypothetical protein